MIPVAVSVPAPVEIATTVPIVISAVKIPTVPIAIDVREATIVVADTYEIPAPGHPISIRNVAR